MPLYLYLYLQACICVLSIVSSRWSTGTNYSSRSAVGPGISLSLQSLTRKVSPIVSPTARLCSRRHCLLSCSHSWQGSWHGVAWHPRDLLEGRTETSRLREGKTLAQSHLPVGRGGRVNFLTLSQQSSLTVDERLWDRQATREY